MPSVAQPFRHRQTVEICSRDCVGVFGTSFFVATLLAAVGKNRYLVRYQTRFTPDRSRLLTAVVEAADVRPLPPQISAATLSESYRVDAYLNGAWRVGKVAKKVDPNFFVRLECSGDEVHCPFYRVRVHLDWEDGKWICRRVGPQGGETKDSSTGQDIK